MGVVKLSNSKLQVQFISDEGVVYVTSVKYLLGMLNRGDAGFILRLNRLPLPVSDGRFPKSEVWNPNGYTGDTVDGSKQGRDVLSVKGREGLKEVVGFKDKEVW